jgi:hypothetical protein
MLISDPDRKFRILTDPVPDPDPQHCKNNIMIREMNDKPRQDEIKLKREDKNVAFTFPNVRKETE